MFMMTFASEMLSNNRTNSVTLIILVNADRMKIVFPIMPITHTMVYESFIGKDISTSPLIVVLIEGGRSAIFGLPGIS